jgi:hypothetical protein
MPYCVNCGTEIPRGCKKCLICGNNPWILAEAAGEGKPAKSWDKTEKLYLAPILSIFVLFAAIFLLFGFSIWQLGVFGGAGGGYYSEYDKTTTVGGPREIMLGMPYHVYRAFDFGDFAIFVNIIGLSMLVWSWYKLQKTVKSIRTLIISISGVILIIFAFFIFIFGFNDLLTFTGGNVYYKPTFTQQYGWVIESIIFGFLGYFLLLSAERLERKEDVKTSLYPPVMIPVAYVLILVVLWVYIFGLHNTLHTGDYTKYRTNMAWVVETFVFGLSCILLFIRAGKIRRAEEGRLDLTKPLIFASSIFLIATLVVYLFSIHSTFWDLKGEIDLIWIAELLCLGIPCVAFLIKAEDIRRKCGGERSIYPHMLIPVSAILLFVTVFVYIAGVHFSLYGLSYSKVNFSWIIEVILYGIPSITFLIASDNIRKREKQEKPILPLALVPVSYLLLFITLLVFIFGVHSTLWGYGDDDFRWIVETIVFLVPSLICLIYGRKITNIRFTFLIFASVILLISALPVYILGIHWLLDDYGNNSSDLIRILIETLVFAVPAAIFLISADRMKETGKVKSILPYALFPISCILLLAFLITYISGIHGVLADTYGKNDFMWLIEALLFLTPSVYFMWKSEGIRKREEVTGSVFIYPLYGLVAILLAATLFSFIFGLNEFLYSTEQDLNWIIETLVYLISAAVPLYISEKIPSRR